MTVGALNAEKKNKARVIVWNDSSTIELTMNVREIKDVEKRFFIDIEDVISNELMGKLLHHFRDQGMLLDSEGIRV
tara:strand:- start:194 stop:421 length:228 start_codon:yes stop_codon:yes gene_type:complete